MSSDSPSGVEGRHASIPEGARVLVTGATGFIGCRLLEILREQGVHAVGTGRVANDIESARQRRLEQRGIRIISGNVTDAAACRSMVDGCSHVIHLAAAQHEVNIPRKTFFDVNVEGTRKLLEASAAAGVQRFVFGSTIGVYGDGGRQELDETSPVHPLNEYGESKLAAEVVVLEWGSRLPVTIARIGDTYGPGDPRLLKLFRAVARGRFMIIGDGLNLRQPVYVDDLARGLTVLASNPAAVGGIFLLAGAQTVTTRELVADVAAATGRAGSSCPRVPLWPFSIAANVMERVLRPLGIQPPLHPRRLDFFRKSFIVSSRKAATVLGHEPRVDFATGAKLTADWYRAQKLL